MTETAVAAGEPDGTDALRAEVAALREEIRLLREAPPAACVHYHYPAVPAAAPVPWHPPFVVGTPKTWCTSIQANTACAGGYTGQFFTMNVPA